MLDALFYYFQWYLAMAPLLQTIGRITGRTALVGCGAGLWGWWLAAFAAHPAIILMTSLVQGYLLLTGNGGMVPASTWVALLIALAVAVNVFPEFWSDGIRYQYWALTLMLLWVTALGSLYLLACHGQWLRQASLPTRWVGRILTLVGLLWALQMGAVIYYQR